MYLNKEKITGLVREALQDREDLFVTEVKVKPDNTVYVFMDGDHGVTVEDCIRVSRFVEKHLDRDRCDFELNVSSYGIGRPLVLMRQYQNAVGKMLVVKMEDGTKLKGKLIAVDERQLTIEQPAVKKSPAVTQALDRKDIKEAKVEVTF